MCPLKERRENLFEDHHEKQKRKKSEKFFSRSLILSYRFNSPHSFTRAHKKTKNTRRERGVTNSLSLSLSLSRFVRGRRPERERDGGQKTKREREREEQIKEFFFFIFIFPLFFSPLSPLKISLLKIEKSFVSLVLRNDENDKDNNDGWIGGAKQREESAIENVAEQEGAFEVRKSCCLIVFEKGVNSTDTLSLKRSFSIFFLFFFFEKFFFATKQFWYFVCCLRVLTTKTIVTVGRRLLTFSLKLKRQQQSARIPLRSRLVRAFSDALGGLLFLLFFHLVV